jgi:hypothetical protein
MNKLVLSLVTIWLSGLYTSAQDLAPVGLTRVFEIIPPAFKVHNSLYRTIEFIDSREDSALIGVVDVGLLKNRAANLILKTPLLPQLQRMVDSMTDLNGQDGALLFQLRVFNFVEETGTRYCYLKAALYARTDTRYRKLSDLDTVMIIPVPDITKAIQLIANRILADFMAKGLILRPGDSSSWSISDIQNMDSIEKHRLPVYNTAKYTDGVYLSYTAFKNQLPDRQGMIETKKDGHIASVSILDPQARKIKLKPGEVYAVIFKGMPHIATAYGFYPLQKARDNFFFTADVPIVPSYRDVTAETFAMRNISFTFVDDRPIHETFDMIIDHYNGDFIHLRRIVKTDTP